MTRTTNNERRLLLALTLTALAGSTARADIIHLKPVGKLEGTIKEERPDGTVVIKLDAGGTTTIKKAYIDHIEKKAPRTPPPIPGTKPGVGPTRPTNPTGSRPGGRPGYDEDKDMTIGPRLDDFRQVKLSRKDEKNRVPPWARLSGDPDPKDPPAPRISPEAKEEIEKFLNSTNDPGAIDAWLSQHIDSPDKLDYVLWLSYTWPNTDRARVALLKFWATRDGPDRAEEKLLPLCTSDMWYTRFGALQALPAYATWKKSWPVMLRILDVTHMDSNDAARAVVGAMIKRDPPSSEVVDEIIEHHKKAKTGYSASWSYADVLGTLAQNGVTKAQEYLKSAWKKAEGKERVDVFAQLLRGVSPSEAHDLCVQALQDVSTTAQATHPVAAHGLIDYGGTMRDCGLVMAVMDEEGDADYAGYGKLAKGQMQTVANDVVCLLAKRPKFKTTDDLKQWWDKIKDVMDNVDSLISDIQAGTTTAGDSINKLIEIRLDEVDQAIRNAAANCARAEVRAVACEAIATRSDRKGSPSVLEALKKADGATRERICASLRSLALGRSVPLDDPSRALDWWHRNFPGDF